MEERKSYHVSSAGGAWQITVRESRDGKRSFSTRLKALESAISMARGDEPSTVVVHNADGLVQEERTYGDLSRSTHH